jgi:type II secretory pathway pseudopilin PulG
MNRKAAGFTLMETTLALTLLTVGMLTLAGVFSQIIKSNTVVRRKQIAALLATSKLTQLLTSSLTGIDELKGTFDEPFQNYSWQAQFGYRPDNDKVVDIWLEVRHKSGAGIRLWTQMMVKDAQ